MNLFEALLLGLIQGFTEFLPVSSSGHLALSTYLLKLDTPGLGFEVWLHIATLVAVLVALRKDVLKLLRALNPGAPDSADTRASRTIILGIILGTIPAILVGLLAKDLVEQAFGSPKIVGLGLWITAAVLTGTHFIRAKNLPLTLPKAFLIGCGQAVAIFPGVSRSGSTLAMGLVTGLEGPKVARFSFLLSVPAILGATVLEAGSLAELGQSSPLILMVGFLAAALSGFVAIQIVWRVMERGRLWIFAPYCAVVGSLAFFLL